MDNTSNREYLKAQHEKLMQQFNVDKIHSLIDYNDPDYKCYEPTLYYEDESDEDDSEDDIAADTANDAYLDSDWAVNTVNSFTHILLAKCTNTSMCAINFPMCAIYIPDYISEFVISSVKYDIWMRITEPPKMDIDIETILAQTRELPPLHLAPAMDGYNKYILFTPYMSNINIYLPEVVPAIYAELLFGYQPSRKNVYYSKYTNMYYHSSGYNSGAHARAVSNITEYSRVYPLRLLFSPSKRAGWIIPSVHWRRKLQNTSN